MITAEEQGKTFQRCDRIFVQQSEAQRQPPAAAA
jgi:hypothetical protein